MASAEVEHEYLARKVGWTRRQFSGGWEDGCRIHGIDGKYVIFLLLNAGVEIRFHSVPLYNAVYRFDDQMLVTPYLYRLRGYQHPLLHLKRLGPAGIFEAYAHQFEAIWTESRPVKAFNGTH